MSLFIFVCWVYGKALLHDAVVRANCLEIIDDIFAASFQKNKRSVTSFEVVTTTEAYNNDIFCSTFALKSLVPVSEYFAQDVKCEWSAQEGKISSCVFLTLIFYSLFKERTITTWRKQICTDLFCDYFIHLEKYWQRILTRRPKPFWGRSKNGRVMDLFVSVCVVYKLKWNFQLLFCSFAYLIYEV